MKNYALVMAGGKGTRFWPESTLKCPKQYLKLVDKKSLLENTLNRFDEFIENDNRYIITTADQRDLAIENSKNAINDKNFIYEPSGRNTAPCILLALAELMTKGASDDDCVIIVPSDHVILNRKGFQSTLESALNIAREKNNIVTIGIKPNFPHTGYGYIKRGNKIVENSFSVDSFKEKPDRETATKYLEAGDYYWNAGMFVAPIKVLIEEFNQHAKEIGGFLEPLKEALSNNSVEAVYNSIPKESIDYAVMEKSQRVSVVEADFDWNDLGSWDALESVLEPKQENTFVSLDDCYLEESKGNIIFAPKKFVSLVNINDLIIVDNPNVLMILPKSDSQKVKNVYNYLTEQSKNDLL